MQLENEASESNRLRNTLHDAEEHFAVETDALKKQNEEQISQANTEVNNICFFAFASGFSWLTSLLRMHRQNDKQREENKALQESMHVAASNATTELQTKDKRIRQLERKVIKIIYHFRKIAELIKSPRYNLCEMSEPRRHANSP